MSISRDAISRILLFSFFIIPFTELRFGFLGLGEICLIISFLLLLFLDKGKIFYSPIFFVVKFWSYFILFLLIGFCYNFFILDHSSGTIHQAAFDFLAYIFVFILCVILSNTNNLGKDGAFVFFFRLYSLWFVCFSILFVFSFFIKSIFGFTLRTYTAFTPLVENVHQAAMLFCVLPFLGMFFLFQQKDFYNKLWVSASIVLFGLMAVQSTATKATMALVIGISVFALSFILLRSKSKRITNYNILLIILFLIISISLIFINFEFIINKLIDFFLDEDIGGGRQDIYTNGFLHAANSLFFGYGPGPHILYIGSYWDTHMTFLTILLQSGLFGLILFFIFLARSVKVFLWSPALLASFSSIMTYALGGDILRRLPVWIIVMAIIILGSEFKKNNRAIN